MFAKIVVKDVWKDKKHETNVIVFSSETSVPIRLLLTLIH